MLVIFRGSTVAILSTLNKKLRKKATHVEVIAYFPIYQPAYLKHR